MSYFNAIYLRSGELAVCQHCQKRQSIQGYAFLMGTEKCTLLFFYKMK